MVVPRKSKVPFFSQVSLLLIFIVQSTFPNDTSLSFSVFTHNPPPPKLKFIFSLLPYQTQDSESL